MNNNSRTLDYADNNDIKTADTTSEANGYPKNLRHVLTFDTITHILKCSEELTAEGHTVTELMLHKRDGWQLWARTGTSITHGMFRRASNGEWTIEMSTAHETCAIAFEVIVKDKEITSLNHMWSLLNRATRFEDELSDIKQEVDDRGNTDVTIFYDPDQDYRINYWADNETVGYSHDTHSYQVALMVDWKDSEDEDND